MMRTLMWVGLGMGVVLGETSMVVDGRTEFVGRGARSAESAVCEALVQEAGNGPVWGAALMPSGRRAIR